MVHYPGVCCTDTLLRIGRRLQDPREESCMQETSGSLRRGREGAEVGRRSCHLGLVALAGMEVIMVSRWGGAGRWVCQRAVGKGKMQ